MEKTRRIQIRRALERPVLDAAREPSHPHHLSFSARDEPSLGIHAQARRGELLLDVVLDGLRDDAGVPAHLAEFVDGVADRAVPRDRNLASDHLVIVRTFSDGNLDFNLERGVAAAVVLLLGATACAARCLVRDPSKEAFGGGEVAMILKPRLGRRRSVRRFGSGACV